MPAFLIHQRLFQILKKDVPLSARSINQIRFTQTTYRFCALYLNATRVSHTSWSMQKRLLLHYDPDLNRRRSASIRISVVCVCALVFVIRAQVYAMNAKCLLKS